VDMALLQWVSEKPMSESPDMGHPDSSLYGTGQGLVPENREQETWRWQRRNTDSLHCGGKSAASGRM